MRTGQIRQRTGAGKYYGSLPPSARFQLRPLTPAQMDCSESQLLADARRGEKIVGQRQPHEAPLVPGDIDYSCRGNCAVGDRAPPDVPRLEPTITIYLR